MSGIPMRRSIRARHFLRLIVIPQQRVDSVALAFEVCEGRALQHFADGQADAHGVDFAAVDDQLIVQVRAGREAGGADIADDLALADARARGDAVGDGAVTMLINSRVEARQATGVVRNRATLDLSTLPGKALGETTDGERQVVAELIGAMTSWPGIGASVATKTLHKKRPALIPVLDNMAIFGAYMYPLWPENRALADTVKAVPRIKEALDWIAVDVTRPENEAVWSQLDA